MKFSAVFGCLVLCVISVSGLHAQDLLKNTKFTLGDKSTPGGWGIAVYVSDHLSDDWKASGNVTFKEDGGSLVVEESLASTLVTLYQPAVRFLAGQRYRLTLTYDDSSFEGKILVLFDGGSAGVQGVPVLEFPRGSAGFVTNSLEVEMPSDATPELLGKTSFQVRLLGVGTVRLKEIVVDPL